MDRAPLSPRVRTALMAVLGGLLLALEIVLRGQHDLTAQVVGQSVAFALFVPAAALAWRGLATGRLGLGLILAFAIGFRVAVFAPEVAPPLSTDLYRYAWDARVESAGINPYRYAPTDPALEKLQDRDIWPQINLPDWHTPYPPAAQGSFLASRALFGSGARATTWLFMVAEAGAVALLLLVLSRAGAPLERVALYAWHPLAISEAAANGHFDALAVLALAGLLAAWQARRFTLAGTMVGLATLVKLGPALLVPALMRRGGWRYGAAAVVVCGLGYLPFLSVGTGVVGSIFRLLHQDEFGSLEPILSPHLGRTAAQGLLVVAFVGVLAAVALRRHETLGEMARSCLLVLGALLVTTTLLQPWYALWLLPFLTIVPAPGWLWLTGALPLLYLNGPANTLPGWVAWAIYAPLGAWAAWRTVGLVRSRPSRWTAEAAHLDVERALS